MVYIGTDGVALMVYIGSNPDLTLLLLDTEGLDAPHVQQSYNWALSAMALLISDVFIYQTRGMIDKGLHSATGSTVVLQRCY